MKLSGLPPTEQLAAIERMIREAFAGLDAEGRTIAERWLDEHLAGFCDADLAFLRHLARFFLRIGPQTPTKLTSAEVEALWQATEEPDTLARVH